MSQVTLRHHRDHDPQEAKSSDMVWIAGGTFRMGSDRHYPEEAPVHRVTLDGFWIDRTPITNRQFRDFVRATGEGFDQLPIPAASKAFLQDPGLPRQAGLQLTFVALAEPLRDLATVVASDARIRPQPVWSRYLVIGRDSAAYLCAVRDGGEICAVWPHQGLERYVNRGVSELAACLLCYREVSRGSKGTDDEVYARELRRCIARTDETALEGDEHWWAVVVEQAGGGDL